VLGALIFTRILQAKGITEGIADLDWEEILRKEVASLS
jgi:hypothetical protein